MKVPPFLAVEHLEGVLRGNAELRSEGFKRHTFQVRCANRNDVIPRKSRATARRAEMHAVLGPGIARVIEHAPKEEMLVIHARGIVATVKDALAGRNRAVLHFVRETMRVDATIANAERAVAVTCLACSPFDASRFDSDAVGREPGRRGSNRLDSLVFEIAIAGTKLLAVAGDANKRFAAMTAGWHG